MSIRTLPRHHDLRRPGFWTNIGDVGQSAADALLARALDAGINFIDTADVYSEGLSEEITGRAIANSGRPRTDFVLATKVNGSTGKGPNDRGSSRGHIMDALKASLKRLGTDYIDLYQIHGQDPLAPVEETVRALEDLVRQGHVRYVGCSNWAAWKIMQALALRQPRLDALRLAAGLLHHCRTRSGARDRAPASGPGRRADGVEPACRRASLGQIRPYGKGPDGARRTTFDFPLVDKDRAFDCIDAMRPIAEAHGCRSRALHSPGCCTGPSLPR